MEVESKVDNNERMPRGDEPSADDEKYLGQVEGKGSPPFHRDRKQISHPKVGGSPFSTFHPFPLLRVGRRGYRGS